MESLDQRAVLCVAAGFTAGALLGAHLKGASGCPVPGVGPQTPADNGYQGGFAVGLMLKDLKLASEAAASVGASVPMGNAAEALYQMLANRGEAGRDFSAMIEMLEGK